MQVQEVARRIYGAVAGEAYAKVIYQVPITNPYPSHYIFCISFSSPPLHLCHFICPSSAVCLSFACFLFACVCWIAFLSLWLGTIPNCVTSPIPTTMTLLALRLLPLPMLKLVKSMLLC